MPESKLSEVDIDAICLRCGYKLDWRILSANREVEFSSRSKRHREITF